MTKERGTTFRVGGLEPVDGKIPTETQNFFAQKTDVRQWLLSCDPYKEVLIKPHWH